MTLAEAMTRLESLADPKIKTINHRSGAGVRQFGVKLGDIRNLAKEIKVDHSLALELWETGNLDARLLAILILKPKQLSKEQMDKMVGEAAIPQSADWLSSYVLKHHPDKEALRIEWMASAPDQWRARAGWYLTDELICKAPEGLDLVALLTRLEAEMGKAPYQQAWTMNYCLAGIGINFPELRERALAIGEKLGVFRDYPTPKGCTSPFAPIWIAEMVRRQS